MAGRAPPVDPACATGDAPIGPAPLSGNRLERYLECGLLCHGFARVRCDDCGHGVLVPLSCKTT